MLIRQAARKESDIRNVSFVPHTSVFADGSCVAKMGNTQIFCTASLDDEIRGFHVEYSVLPSALHPRSARSPETLETLIIQDTIRRSLESITDIDALSDRGVRVDCHVLQAEGSLRPAAISGAYVAVALAFRKVAHSMLNAFLKKQIAAISCGIIKGELILDLDQDEACQAEVMGDFVFDYEGNILGLYFKSHGITFPIERIVHISEMALRGARVIFSAQNQALSS